MAKTIRKSRASIVAIATAIAVLMSGLVFAQTDSAYAHNGSSGHSEYDDQGKYDGHKTHSAASKSKKKHISKSKALRIALKNAKLKRSQVYDVDVEKDYERGRWIYEVSFSHKSKEYDYDIAVKGGKILKKHVEYDD